MTIQGGGGSNSPFARGAAVAASQRAMAASQRAMDNRYGHEIRASGTRPPAKASGRPAR